MQIMNIEINQECKLYNGYLNDLLFIIQNSD